MAKDRWSPFGWWHCDGRPELVVTVFAGIENKIKSSTGVRHAKGCDIDSDDTRDFAEAVKVASGADVVILVVGEGQAMSGEGGSRTVIGLPGNQLELVKAVSETRKPVVVVLMNGRPLAIPWIAEHVPAIVVTWQAGSQCGNAVADILFDDVNPGGKLPVSWPRVSSQEPLYYNHKNTGRPPAENCFTARYQDISVEPQFPFGYGLSYTTFRFSDLALSAQQVGPAGLVTISALVENTGQVPGDEVAQLYLRDLVASMTRPVKELKGFQSITLAPGEKKRVQFTLGPEHLGFYNQHLEYVVEPGTFKVWIGPNSVEGLEGSFEVVGR